MKRKTTLFLVIVQVMFVLVAEAQVPTEQQPMSLQTCIEEARQNNLSLRTSRAKVLASEAKASEAFAALLPQVRLSSRVAQLSDVEPFRVTAPGLGSLTLFPNIDHSYSARVSVQQPVFTGFRLINSVKLAELNATMTQEELVRDERDLILEVTKTYWNLARALQVEELLRQTVAQVSEHLRDVQNFFQQGLVTENEVYKVEVQLAEVQLKLIEAESNRRLVNMALNNLVGRPLEAVVVPSDDPEQMVMAFDVDEQMPKKSEDLLKSAYKHRPELKATRARKEMSEAGVSAARAGWYPQVALTAGYDYAKPNQRIIPPTDRWEGTWDVGLTAQWNVWDWLTTSHQVNQAQAAVQQSNAALQQLENAVAMQVMQQYWKVNESRQKRIVAKKAVEQATENHRVTNEKFKRGVSTNTDLLDAEVALLQARLNYLQANIDYQVAHAQIIHASGMPYEAAVKN